MKKVSYTVICSANKEHKFPVVYEIENGSEGVNDTAIEFCPFCGALVSVNIKGRLKSDTDVHRMLGFKTE